MASSSQRGLIALPWDVLVLKAFLLVSTGKPIMSISTYVPTFLSDRNWPEMIWKEGVGRKARGQERVKNILKHTHRQSCINTKRPTQTNTHLDRQCVGYYPIHCALSERVKVFIWPSHKLWFESVATFPIVLIHAQVQLHGQICEDRMTTVYLHGWATLTEIKHAN